MAAHIVNTWGGATQNLNHIISAMAMVGIPPRATAQPKEFSVIHGLRAAVEALSEPSDIQKEQLIATKRTATKTNNRGRVICITSARDDASMKSLNSEPNMHFHLLFFMLFHIKTAGDVV